MSEPVKIELELNLDAYLVAYRGMGRDGEEIVAPQTIEEIIIERAALGLLQQVAGDRDSLTPLRERVRRITDDEIRERVAPQIETALAHPFRRSNAYGEPTGAETTLREEVVRVATEYLSKPTGRYDKQQTAVESFIAGEVKKAVDAELKDALKAAKAEVAAAVTAQASALITKTITDLAGVR